jgi:hypothetical protein
MKTWKSWLLVGVVGVDSGIGVQRVCILLCSDIASTTGGSSFKTLSGADGPSSSNLGSLLLASRGTSPFCIGWLFRWLSR